MLDPLRTALTYLRGAGGLQVVSFWQDVSQVERLYPRDYESILNASAAIVGLGLTPLISAKLAPVMGVDVRRLCDVRPDGAVAWTKERGFEELTRRDYLKDAALLRLADPNPRFKSTARPDGKARDDRRA